MHERTQRAIARLMFVFCCAIPTSLTLFCVLVTWTPWYHRYQLGAIVARVSREADMIVEIDDFRRDAPNAMRLFGVRVLDSETQQVVAKVREVGWISRGTGTSILLHQPELQSKQLLQSWHVIHDRFLCRPRQHLAPIKLAANDLTIKSQTGSLTLRDIDAWVEPRDRSVEATLQCHPANARQGSPVRVSVRRDREGELPFTKWALETGDTPLPCSAIAEFIPLMGKLGEEAEFQGSLSWRGDGKAWSIDLGGSRFNQVSLDRLLQDQTHRLTGTASVGFDRCRIEPLGRRSDVSGWIKAENGFVGRSLLISSHQELGFQIQVPAELIDSKGDVPFDRLALGFNINDTRLRLNGICRMDPGYGNLGPGVVMRLGYRPLVQSSDTAIDSLRVVSAIAPAHSVAVPLSSQTSWLMSVFIPPSRPQNRDEGVVPRISSIRQWNGGPQVNQPEGSGAARRGQQW